MEVEIELIERETPRTIGEVIYEIVKNHPEVQRCW